MRKSVVWLSIALTLCAMSPVTTVADDPSIVVGTHYLAPNTPDQVVELYVTGGALVGGLGLNMIVADGGPSITAIDAVTDTIFADNNIGQFDDLATRPIPQEVTVYMLTAAGAVSADGLLARITFDTTGLTEGSFSLSLTVEGSPTVFSSEFGDDVTTHLTDGTLIIGEPPSDNQPPVVDAGPGSTVEIGTVVHLTGTASDPESNPLTYSWQQTDGPAVTLSGTNTLTPSFTAPLVAVNTDLTFTLTVSDGTNSVSDTVTVTVTGNAPPVVDAGLDRNVQAGVTVELSGTATDPENQPLTYLWQQVDGYPVVLSNASTATASFTAPSAVVNTKLAFQFAVSDGINVRSDAVIITVGANEQSFSVDAGPDQTVANGASVHLPGSITYPDGVSLTMEWVQIGGPWVTFSVTNNVNASFQAPNGVTNTIITFQFSATDGTNKAVDTVNIEVNADETKPAADAGPDQAVNAAATVQLDGVGTDPQETGLTYAWVQISGTNVTLSDTTVANPTFVAPSLSVANDLVFEFRVISGDVLSIDTVTIHVAAAEPVVNPPDTSTDDNGPNDGDTGSNQDSDTDTGATPENNTSTPFSLQSILSGFALLLLGLFLLFFFFFLL